MCITTICTHPIKPPIKSILKAMNIGKYIQMYSELKNKKLWN